ncbi:MAG: hypothetical protein MJZ84_07795 [Paludibacteraceae bacterium]|nr:hypothetical protein [Paludibacteraceae bacterium]
MADFNLNEPYADYHGKSSRMDEGYSYVLYGKQHYRKRKETYQQHQHPKQKWNTSAMSWAQKSVKAMLQDPVQAEQMKSDWVENKKKGPSGKVYSTPARRQIAILQQQWKQEHPFEEWYSAYLAEVSATAEKKTASESTSQYMLKQQIKALHAQLAELEKRLEK